MVVFIPECHFFITIILAELAEYDSVQNRNVMAANYLFFSKVAVRCAPSQIII